MKPADHPDFFRLPPPPGRSRESEIVLDREGQFYDHGLPVEHPAMAAAFHTWIDRHPDDGRYILNNGYDWTYFRVEDVPFRIEGVSPLGSGLEVSLDDGSREPLTGPVWCGAEGVLYARVKGGRFDARFARDVQADLGRFLAEGPSGVSLPGPLGDIPVLDGPPPRSPEQPGSPSGRAS